LRAEWAREFIRCGLVIGISRSIARDFDRGLSRRDHEHGLPGLSRAKALQQSMNALINEGVFVDSVTKRTGYSYAHPIFWRRTR
jgi:hypothetical protein